MHFQDSLSFAQQQDAQDELRSFRQHFHIPQHQGNDSIYFCGNSLGLQPKGVQAEIDKELKRWASLGIEGFFQGDTPWLDYHRELSENLVPIVGAADASEVIVMNTLTVNLHLMMVSFYRPDNKRHKIIMEAGAFPSDQYAVESQVRFHGLNPETSIVEVTPKGNGLTLETTDILEAIEEHGNETALVLFGGVNYYTGQAYDMGAIAAAAQKAGAQVGLDLAHGAGNVPLQLHDWGVDFAVWCSYKYLNSGPGAPSGTFVHQRHANNPDLPRFAGWWGYDQRKRFLMRKGFVPAEGAAGWQLSTPLILSFVPHRVSLRLFAEAGMSRLRTKSERLTGYLEFLIDQLQGEGYAYQFITPREANARGAQLSFITGKDGKQLFDFLTENGVICDWREHNLPGAADKAGVIRIAPTPMYNSYEEVWRFADLLRQYGK